jgi:hypothetical protein
MAVTPTETQHNMSQPGEPGGVSPWIFEPPTETGSHRLSVGLTSHRTEQSGKRLDRDVLPS